MLKKRILRGFTLIELIIVIVIIGILASVGAPMMSSNIQRAKMSEAVAAMGGIRGAERAYYVENGRYVNVGPLSWEDDIFSNPLNKYITAGDLSGRYFSPICYSVTVTDTGYNIYSNLLVATEAGCQAQGNLIMNETGYLTVGL